MNGPVVFLMLGVPALVFSTVRLTVGDVKLVGVWIAILALLWMPLGFVPAWLWWSFNVPKWRLWAYERVDDIPTLKRRAVAVGLTWPDGHFFERTEIKSKAHAARERELERGGRPR